MTNQEYVDLVSKGVYPKDRRVPLDNTFVNHNGVINNLVLSSVNSVVIIKSLPKTVRSNHYHLTDSHYIYVISGCILYFERSAGSKEISNPILFKAGEMFFTPPMIEHATVFPEETTFLALATKIMRTHENHEEDLVRVDFITPQILSDFLSNYETSRI